MGLMDMGFDKPTPIQEQAIPVLLDGKDILASAQTGTGKTAAFAIPLIEKIGSNPKPGIRALVLAPTRELAIQIDQQFWSIGYHAGITSACIYGGADWSTQEKAIREGVDILVATPGRLIDHIKVSSVDFSALEFLVLDEADRMLDMGFLPDVRSIIHRLPKKRQSLLFSATLSGNIETLAKEMTNDPVRINISTQKPAEGVTQQAYKIQESGKLDLVLNLFDTEDDQTAIIFVSTKRGVDGLARALYKKGVRVGSMHGDRDQKEREQTLSDFTNNRINVIVATDVMARGIDVTGVSHVVNYNVPRDLDDYIHRIGRTARAKKKGTAITLVSPEDSRYFSTIIKEMGDRIEIKEMPDGLSDFASDSSDNRGSSSTGRQSRSNSSGRSGGRAPSRRNSSSRPKRNDNTSDDDRSQNSDRSEGQDRSRAAKPAAPRTSSRKKDTGSDSETSAPTADKKKPAPRRKSAPRRKPETSEKTDTRDQSNSRRTDSPDRRNRAGRNSGNRNPRPAGNRNAKNNVDQKQIERIKKVIEPFGGETESVNKSDTKSKSGIWGKITSIFGKD